MYVPSPPAPTKHFTKLCKIFRSHYSRHAPLLSPVTRSEVIFKKSSNLYDHLNLGVCYPQERKSERAHVFRMDGIPRTSSHFCWKNGFREWNFPKSIVLVQLNARILMCYQYESKYVLKKFTGTQEVGPPRQNQVGKQRFSNLTHTWLTYFLCAHTKNQHIVGLLLVTHRD